MTKSDFLKLKTDLLVCLELILKPLEKAKLGNGPNNYDVSDEMSDLTLVDIVQV